MNTGIQGPTLRPDGYWICRVECGYKPNGRRNRPAVVRRNKTEAVAAAKAIRKKYLAEGPQGLRLRSLTVRALTEDWMSTAVVKLAPKTQQQYEMYAGRFFTKVLGRRRVGELTSMDVERMMAVALDSGSAHYANGALRAFKTMLRHGQRKGAPVPAEVLAMKPIPAGTSNRLAMTEQQIGNVLDVLEGYPDRSRWYLPLMYTSRQMEGLGLTLPKIDFERNTITLDRQLTRIKYKDRRAGTFSFPDGRDGDYLQVDGGIHLGPVKTENRALTLPLVGVFKDELASWLETSPPHPFGLVWARDDRHPRDSTTDREQWHEIQAKAKVSHPSGRPYHEHELKHTAATLLTSLGVPIAARTAILGHATEASARPYVHTVSEDIQTALERLDTRLRTAPRQVRG